MLKRRSEAARRVLSVIALFTLVALCLPALAAYAEGGRDDVPIYTWIALSILAVWKFRAFLAQFEANREAYRQERAAQDRAIQEAYEGVERREMERLRKTVPLPRFLERVKREEA